MPGVSLQADAFVLTRGEPSGSYQPFELFSAEAGVLRAYQRVPSKPAPSHIPLDLFDEASLFLESANQGRTWFVREVRLIERRSAIGRSYEALLAASALARVVARNPGPEDSRTAVAGLLRSAFAAFGAQPRPDAAYVKSLYLFARDEGYPVRQEWFPSLADADREIASALLNRPLEAQHHSAEEVTRIRQLLENYLKQNTEILLD